MTTSTQTDDRRLTTDDCPAWVRADRAAQHAWAHDKAWRKAARSALPPVHRAAGAGGTLGDQLLAQARRDWARSQAHTTATAPDRHHAAECNCPPCRKRKGHKPLPTLKQQQERRKDQQYRRRDNPLHDPGDDWRITQDRRVSFVRLDWLDRDSERDHGYHDLRPDFIRKRLDLHWLERVALDHLKQRHPEQGEAVQACIIDGRSQVDHAAHCGVHRKTVKYRLTRGLAYLRAAWADRLPATGG